MDYSEYQYLLFERKNDGVLLITINRPEKYNATNNRLHWELTQVFLDVGKDPETRVVVITGAGKAFSAGGDLDMVDAQIKNFKAVANIYKEAADLVYNIINCSKPTISAINGVAVGAGLVAALLSDIPIAAKSARIIDGHTRLGVAAGDHAVINWPLLCGMAKAKYYLMLCEQMSGEEAERIGVVSLCVEDDALQDKAVEIAVRLAAGAPSAIRWTKYTLNNWYRMMGPAFDASTALEMLGFAGSEVREGLASHLEKRKPVFDPKSPV